MAKSPNQAGNVVAIKRIAPIVSPPDGWVPNCKYGLQRADDSPRGLLVRLEEVAVWLAQSKPRDDVIRELFSPLIVDDGIEARALYVLNARGYAQPLIVGDAPNQKMIGFWQDLPFVDRATLPEYVARDIAEEWCDAWPGLADPRTDSDWWHELVIRNNLERTRRFKQDEPALTEGAGFDTETRLAKMHRLGKLAIRLEQANALWGYGDVFNSAQESEAGNLPIERQKSLKWTDDRLAKLLSDFEATPGKTLMARRAVLAKTMGMSAANVKKYLAKAKCTSEARGTLWRGLVTKAGSQ